MPALCSLFVMRKVACRRRRRFAGARTPFASRTGPGSLLTAPPGSLLTALLRRHADCAVEAYHFAVEHGITDDFRDQRRILRGPAKPRWKRDHLSERLLHFDRHAR